MYRNHKTTSIPQLWVAHKRSFSKQSQPFFKIFFYKLNSSFETSATCPHNCNRIRENKNETVDFLENSTGINQSRSRDIFLSQLQIIKLHFF